MPEGQFSGARGKYAYESDGGETYNLTLDTSLVVAATGLAAAVAGTGTGKPLNFKPRGVYWQATGAGFEGKRKFLVCAADAAAYVANTRTAITIDGVAGVTTGRRGEQFSY